MTHIHTSIEFNVRAHSNNTDVLDYVIATHAYSAHGLSNIGAVCTIIHGVLNAPLEVNLDEPFQNRYFKTDFFGT